MDMEPYGFPRFARIKWDMDLLVDSFQSTPAARDAGWNLQKTLRQALQRAPDPTEPNHTDTMQYSPVSTRPNYPPQDTLEPLNTKRVHEKDPTGLPEA